jgi:PAS domain-containing protein
MIWTLSDALGISFPATGWVVLAYLGIGALPTSWLAFCLEFSGRGRWLNQNRLVGLSVVPLFTLLVVATNDFHHWMWQNIPTPSGIRVEYGFWLVFSASYSYFLFFAGFLFLLVNLAEAAPVHRRQGMILLIAGIIPWMANLLQILDIYPRTAPNPTPLGFIVSALIFFWGLFRLQLLEIMPIAQKAVIKQMEEGLMILDSSNRIIQVNPAAESLLNIREVKVSGKNLSAMLDSWPEFSAAASSGDSFQVEILRPLPQGAKYYDLKSALIRDDLGQQTGRFLMIREVTPRKQAELEREKLVGELKEALAKVKTLSGLLPICASCKKIRDDQGYWNTLELYIQQHSHASFSHGLCPECIRKLCGNLDLPPAE